MDDIRETPDRYRTVAPFWSTVLTGLSALGLCLALLQAFNLWPFGFMLIENAYLYWVMTLFIPQIYLLFPATKTSPRHKIPWYDFLLFFLCLSVSQYFASQSFSIVLKGWEFGAPLLPKLLALGLWLMVLEAVRRTSGWIITAVCIFFSFYPLFAGYMPGFMQGQSYSLLILAGYHVMSGVSILGIPMQAVGNLLIGFLIFGVALQATGGGQFFLDFALSLMGNRRGGPAKVSVISSALFGTISGSVISNVLVDGPFTIPAMKKAGYPGHYAAAIEAVASTGGGIMPPVMGTAGFVMASFLLIPYAQVALCAFVPAVLYYAGLFFQIDCYAAKTGIKGLQESELPSFWRTLRKGWFFVLAIFTLVVLVFLIRREAQAPFYCILLLFLCTMINKTTRLSGKDFIVFVRDSGRLIAEITAILAAIGLVIGSWSMTGLAEAFARELSVLVGEHIFPLLFIGAFVSFILGMGMTATACYIFLAITVAPALTSLGLNPISVHLFVLYWGQISFITPPVALGAVAAAPLGGADPMRTGYAAMRLGSVIYFVPFFFVLNPALILIGSPTNIVFSVITAFIGVYLIAAALEGYIIGLGRLGPRLRILIGISGLAIFAPWRISEATGTIILAIAIAYGILERRKRVKIPG